jgi:single-strand DNA-binding protein
MANLNKVLLIGNLTRDPELRYVPSGNAVVSFGLAVNTPILRQGAEKKDETCFVKIVVWGKQAESCKKYLSKGRPVFVEGRLVYRSWEQDGKTRSTMEVKADRVQFLGSPRREDSSSSGAQSEQAEDMSVEEPVGEGALEEEPPF